MLVPGLADGILYHLRPGHPVIDAVAFVKVDDTPWLREVIQLAGLLIPPAKRVGLKCMYIYISTRDFVKMDVSFIVRNDYNSRFWLFL